MKVHDLLCEEHVHVWRFRGPLPARSGVCVTDKKRGDNGLARKRLAATASRREGVYNRTGEANAVFCGEEERRSE